MEAILSLDQLVDESDPDVDFPNSFHAFQTAEGIRQVHPDKGAIDRKSDKNTQDELYVLNWYASLIAVPVQTGSSWWVWSMMWGR